MKKSILSLAVVAFACGANAQIAIQNDKGDLTSTAAEKKAGYVLGQDATSGIKYYILNTESIKLSSLDVDGYKQVKFGDAVLENSYGITGSSNPAAPTLAEEAKEDGSYLQFTATGYQPVVDLSSCKEEEEYWVYVPGKWNSSKNYYVAEFSGADGNFAATASAVTYQIVVYYPNLNTTEFKAVASSEFADGIFNWSVSPKNEEGYYTGKSILPWNEMVMLGNTYDSEKNQWAAGEKDEPYATNAVPFLPEGKTKLNQNGIGVIKFKAFGGMKYAVFANGSKTTTSGVFVSPKEVDVTLYAPETTNSESGEVTPEKSLKIIEVAGGSTPTAITTPIADIVNGGAAYNISGQRVNDNAKGLVIKNGKKYLVK